MSSSSAQKIAQPLMTLELFLGVNQDESSDAKSGLINSHCSSKAI